MRIVMEWRCDRCRQTLTTRTRLTAIPTHQCGSKRTPQEFQPVDNDLLKKVIFNEQTTS